MDMTEKGKLSNGFACLQYYIITTLQKKKCKHNSKVPCLAQENTNIQKIRGTCDKIYNTTVSWSSPYPSSVAMSAVMRSLWKNPAAISGL